MLKNFKVFFLLSLITSLTGHSVIAPKKAFNINIPINALQKQYNNAKSATFSFSQIYSHPIFPVNEESFGVVHYKMHNMKWHYQKPINRERVFYIKNNQFVYHLIKDNIAYKHDCFSEDTLSASIMFLWGKGNLKQSFNLSLNEDKSLNQNLLWLSLTPKEKQSSVKSIFLGLNKKSFGVEESVVVDPNDGKNHFKFSNLKINAPVNDKTFDFVPPKNIKIEKMPNVECKEKPKQVSPKQKS